MPRYLTDPSDFETITVLEQCPACDKFSRMELDTNYSTIWGDGFCRECEHEFVIEPYPYDA